MKKTKIAMALGAIVLSIGAFLSTNANKKAFGTTTLYANNVGTIVSSFISHSRITLSSLRAGHTAFFVTQASKSAYHTLLTSFGSSNKWYAK